MREDIYQGFDVLYNKYFPSFIIILFIFINAIPLHIPDLAPVFPLLPIIGIYFWSVRQPESLTSPIVFVMGLLNDLVSGNAMLGGSSLLYLFVQGSVILSRSYLSGRPFFVVWCVFSVIASIAMLLQWILASLGEGHFLATREAFIQLLMTLLFYPIIGWGMTMLQITGQQNN